MDIQITRTRLKDSKFDELRFLSPPWVVVDLQRYLQFGNPAQGESTRGLFSWSLREEQEKGNDSCILGKLLNSLWWPVYLTVFVQVESP